LLGKNQRASLKYLVRVNKTSNKIGKCIIFSAPSGAGKTTIVHYLLKQNLGLSFSVSACSRDSRTNEINGKDYYFIGLENFKQKIKEDAFIEWQEVYKDNFYGTLKTEVQKIWNEGKAVIFDVDVFGGLNLKKTLGEKALAIFVEPPSIQELENRLNLRDTESQEKIKLRISKAKKEMEQAPLFDQIIRNENLEDACKSAYKLVKSFLEK
jgi:guanylate kinase